MPDKKKKKKDEDMAPQVMFRTYVFPNGDRYEGECIVTKEGSLERTGKGKHTTSDGITYEGNWVSDKMTGHGKLSHFSGATYEGDFVNNEFQGKGKYTWPDGSFYEGDFVNNRLEGKGQFTDVESQQWIGMFRFRAAPGLQFKHTVE